MREKRDTSQRQKIEDALLLSIKTSKHTQTHTCEHMCSETNVNILQHECEHIKKRILPVKQQRMWQGVGRYRSQIVRYICIYIYIYSLTN